MKKILIIYATAGIGHKKASMAVREAFDELKPGNAEVTMIDSLDYTNAFFKWSYLQFYLFMVNKLPTLWGISYYLTDNYYVNILVSALRRFGNWLNSAKLVKYIRETKPDVIISTHFFASEVIGDMKRDGSVSARLITVITDYKLHAWWVAENTDMYVVASEEAKTALLRYNVPESRIKVLGIPVEPAFSKESDKNTVLAKSGLKGGVFTILVIGGGFGVGPIEGIMKTIAGMSGSVQAITVCGHNEELVKKINDVASSSEVPIKVLGFVDNVYEYMQVADVLISKSGGITVTESLAKELPMIVISPIIGQETRNCDFLVRNGAALMLGKLSGLKELLEYLIRHPEKLKEMRQAIARIRRPRACYDVANTALDICECR